MTIEYRNAKYTKNNLIDCEINHPELGWIPFTTSPDDSSLSTPYSELFNIIVEDGNVQEYAEVDIPQPLEVILKTFEIALQLHLDNKAKEYGYDNIYTAISYAEEPSVTEFQVEGKAFRSWRSLYWFAANQVKADVASGARQIPAVETLIEELPKLDLPPAELA